MSSQKLNIKELRCFCAVSSLVAGASGSIEALLTAVLPLVPDGWRHSEAVRARIVHLGRSFAPADFKETACSQTARIVAGGAPVGSVTVARLKGPRDPFSKEECLLLDLIAGQLGQGIGRMQAARSLRASDERYRRFVETTQDAFLEIGTDSRLTYVNPRACAMFGYAEGEMLGKHMVEDFQLPEDRPKLAALLKERIAGKRDSFEHRYKKKDGTAFWAWVSGTPLQDEQGRVTGAFAIMTEITSRKAAETALRESEGRYRRFIETTHEGFGHLDAAGRIADANPRLCEILGYSAAEMIGRSPAELLLFPEDREDMEARLQERMQGKPAVHEERRFRRKDGSEVWVSVSSTPIVGPDGTVSGAFTMMSDITARRAAEADLRESEAMFRALFESNSDGILVADASSKRLIFANPAICRMLGYSAEGLTALRAEDIHPKESLDKALEAFEALASENISIATEIPCLRKDGSVFLADITAAPVTIKGTPLLMGLFRDITARKQAERNLVTLQKLESLGVLAGGIAHDFNNILTNILGSVSLLGAHPGLDEEFRKLLVTAQQACRTGQGLSNQLLTFAKGGAPALAVFDLRPALRQAADFAVSGAKVRLVYDLAPTPLAVKADKDQLAQVVQNLVLNAVQAMPGGGEVVLGAEYVDLAAGEVLQLPAGRYVRLTVKDQGEGIAPEHLPNVFDPYFTTKSDGKGLGLAVCHSIMVRHGGAVTAASLPGQGALFSVYIPAGDPAALRKPASDRPLARGTGRILIMDDDELVAMTLSMMLKRLGYASESVSNGAAAVEAYTKAMKAGEPFAAVILDLTVTAGMGGKDAIVRLAEVDPEVRGIVSSGYSNDAVFSRWAEHGFAGALTKPYDLGQVSTALQHALDRA